MEHATIAIDLAKSVFQVAVSSQQGSVEAERRLSRDRFLTYFAQQPPAKIVMEACGSAHHWARQLQQLGHTVRLLPAHDVHRYVRRSKTDRTDAKALLEADRNGDSCRPGEDDGRPSDCIVASASLGVVSHAHRSVE
jgi:transposase